MRPVRPAELDTLLPAAIAMFTEEVGVSPTRVDGGAAYRARVADLVRAGQSLAWIEDGAVLFKADVGAVSRAACQLQGVWVAPQFRGQGIGQRGTAAVVEYARTHDRAGRQPVRQRLQHRRPGRLRARRLPAGRHLRLGAVLSEGPCGPHVTAARRPVSVRVEAVRSRTGTSRRGATRRAATAGGAAVLVLAPLLAGCSSDPSDDVQQAAQAFLDDWTAGRTDAAAALTTDSAATKALLEQTATDLPDATLTADLGDVTVDDDGATVDWTATWDLAAAPDWSYPATLSLTEGDDDWQVVAAPTVVHPELGEGQHLVLTRALAERAPITDATGAPLFTETEVVNVGVDKAQVTDLPALAAGLSAATGVPADEITADVTAAPDGQFVPVITLRRPDFEAIRAQVFDLPGAVFPTSTRLLAPTSRFGLALLGRVGDATQEVLDETTGDDDQPLYAAGDQLGLSGLQRAYQAQLAGTPGFTVTVQSTDESVGDAGEVVDTVDPVPGTPVQTPLVPGAAERRGRRRRRPAAGHPPRRRPAGHRRGAGGELERGGQPGQRVVRSVPAGVEHEDHDRDGAADRRRTDPRQSGALPGDDDGRGPRVRERGPVRPGHRAAHRGLRRVLQHDLHPAGADAARRRAGEGGRLLRGGQRLAAAGRGLQRRGAGGRHRHHQGGRPDRPGPGADEPGADGAGRRRHRQRHPGGAGRGRRRRPRRPRARPARAPTVLDQLRPMMRQVVLTGTATGLADRGEVYGKTGTAEFGDKTPPDSHGWFVGYQLGGPQGDIAFAVLVEAGQSSSVAVDVADAFLGALG